MNFESQFEEYLLESSDNEGMRAEVEPPRPPRPNSEPAVVYKKRKMNDSSQFQEYFYEVSEIGGTGREVEPPRPLRPNSEPAVVKIKNKKKTDFSSQEKKNLASLVRASEPIWNLQHKLHKNNSAIARLWATIAEEIGKPVEDCKAIWRSLRDSMRYHVSGRNKKKSGSEADPNAVDGQALNDESQEIDWEFAESMSFLSPLSSQKRRRTFSTNEIENGAPHTSTSTQSEVHAICSNYAYINENRRPKDPLLESAAALSKNICELIDLQKSKTVQVATPQLKNYTMLANLDRMLQKLSEDVVEDLNVRFICQINEEIKKKN